MTAFVNIQRITAHAAQDDWGPIEHAARRGYSQMLELLLQFGSADQSASFRVGGGSDWTAEVESMIPHMLGVKLCVSRSVIALTRSFTVLDAVQSSTRAAHQS